MGNILNRNAHTAVQSALMHARNEAASARASTLDVDHLEDQFTALAAREISETYHGDGSHARVLAEFATRAGPPTAFTNLPRNGAFFNASAIPSSNSQHRLANNRLEPMENGSRRESNLFPDGVNRPGILLVFFVD